jgi:very-short-patch-repair endonuclease
VIDVSDLQDERDEITPSPNPFPVDGEGEPKPEAGVGSLGSGPAGGIKTERWHTPPHLYGKLKPVARHMRREMTPAENHLWQAIRRRQLSGVKFRRQHTIGRFIVDFYAAEARLVIEVDGPTHDYATEEDTVRQELLEAWGFRTLRFTNDQVLHSLDTVIAQIAAALRDSLSPLTGKGPGDGV